MDIGKFFKGLAIATIGYFAILALLFAANTSVFTFVTSDQEEVKQIVEDSGVYGKIIPALLEQLEREAEQGSKEAREQTGNIPLNNDEVKGLITKSFDEEFVRGASESVLDGMYGWLNGQTEEPRFTINIEGPKNRFINLATDHLYKRAQKLPACSFDQLLQADEFDVWNAPCAPPGIAKSQIKTELGRQINGQKDSLLAKNEILQDDFRDEDGRSAFADLKGTPDAFQTAKWLPWFLVMLAALALVSIVYISDTKVHGIRRAGITLLVSTVVIALSPQVVDFILDRVLNNEEQTAIGRDVLHPLLISFNEASADVYYGFAAMTGLLGTGLVIASLRLKDRLNKTSKDAATK